MKRHCLLALPLLLAGCNGDMLLGYDDRVEVDVVSLSPSRDERLPQYTEGSKPLVLAPAEQRQAISAMRTLLTEAESRRQAAARHLERLQSANERFAIPPDAIERQQSVMEQEALRVRELRAHVKAAELAHRQSASMRHAGPV